MLTDWPGVAAKIITRKMNLISGQITRHLWRLILKIVPKYRDFHPRPVFFWFVVSCSAGNLFDQTSFFSQIHLWLLKLFLMQHEHQMVNINAVFTNKLRNHAYSLAQKYSPVQCVRGYVTKIHSSQFKPYRTSRGKTVIAGLAILWSFEFASYRQRCLPCLFLVS